jgi:DNA-binding NarL/FixJ family response regulator
MINVAIVEDNKIINQTLVTLLDNSSGYKCAGSFTACEELLEVIGKIKADVILMDIKLPGMNGIEGVKRIKKTLPEVNILMLTIYEENELIFDALCAGACGYLVKKTHPEKLLEAIREANDGGAPMSSTIARKVIGFFQANAKSAPEPGILTQREQEILKELATGKTYYAIALDLNITSDTVRFHIKNIYKKLHVHSQAEAVAEAMRKGII